MVERTTEVLRELRDLVNNAKRPMSASCMVNVTGDRTDQSHWRWWTRAKPAR